MSNDTTNVRQADKDTTLDIPSWASLADGKRALENIDLVIGEFKRAHERALEKATRLAWLGFYDNSFNDTLNAVATFRQTIGIAQIVRDRVAKLVVQLEAQ